MPQLKPEDTSMIGLNLFTQLCHLARVAAVSVDSSVGEEQVFWIHRIIIIIINRAFLRDTYTLTIGRQLA